MASYRLGMFLTNTGHIASICLLRKRILSFTTGCDVRRVPEKNLAVQIYFIRPHKFKFFLSLNDILLLEYLGPL